MNRRTLFLIAMAAVRLPAFLAFLAMYQGLPLGRHASAARHWLISKPELARIRAAGPPQVSGGSCATRFPAVTGLPGTTFTSYYAFRQWVLAGGAGTAEIDYEGSVHPHWQMTHLLFYVRLTAQLGARTACSPSCPRSRRGRRCPRRCSRWTSRPPGTARVRWTSRLQWMEQHPWRYAASWRPGCRRSVRPAGHAGSRRPGDRPGSTPVTPWILTRTYSLTRDMVDGYWLNVHPWPGTRCAPQGCPQVAVTFLRNIGA